MVAVDPASADADPTEEDTVVQAQDPVHRLAVP